MIDKEASGEKEPKLLIGHHFSIKKELPEVFNVNRPFKEFFDINDPKYKIHWTSMGNLKSFLERGIYTQRFAEKIKDQHYRTKEILGDGNTIFLTSSRDAIIGIAPELDLTSLVGIVVESVSTHVRTRIAPREFRGLIVFDDQPRWAKSSREAKHYPTKIDRDINIAYTSRMFAEDEKLSPLPVYNQDGDAFWPQYIPHSEIQNFTRREGTSKKSTLKRLLSALKGFKPK